MCSKCERFRHQLKDAVLDERKASLTSAFSQHLRQAQAEREYYLQRCKRSASELGSCSGGAPRYAHLILLGNCIYPIIVIKKVLSISKSGKVQLFGICCDSINVQINYLTDESETIGQNGTLSRTKLCNIYVGSLLFSAQLE